jgi:hypothetical protein
MIGFTMADGSPPSFRSERRLAKTGNMNRFFPHLYRSLTKRSEAIMLDILTFFIAREGLRRPSTIHATEDDQHFYDTAAPLAGKIHAARQRLAHWRHRLPHRKTAGS